MQISAFEYSHMEFLQAKEQDWQCPAKEKLGKVIIDLSSICYNSNVENTMQVDFSDLSPELSSVFKLTFNYQIKTDTVLKASSNEETEFWKK